MKESMRLIVSNPLLQMLIDLLEKKSVKYNTASKHYSDFTLGKSGFTRISVQFLILSEMYSSCHRTVATCYRRYYFTGEVKLTFIPHPISKITIFSFSSSSIACLTRVSH